MRAGLLRVGHVRAGAVRFPLPAILGAGSVLIALAGGMGAPGSAALPTSPPSHAARAAAESSAHVKTSPNRGVRPGALLLPGARYEMAQLFAGDVPHQDPDEASVSSPMPTLESYWKILDLIRSSFYTPHTDASPDETSLTYAAIRGVLSSLDDPYTRFLSPEQFLEMQRENRGTFTGVGVELQVQGDRVLIAVVVPDSPASQAPLERGDEIVRVGGVSVVGKTTDAVGALLKGDEGTSVSVDIQRSGKTLHFTLTRREVRYPHFEYHVMDGSIGYMHLTMFDEQAADNVEKAFQSFSKQGVKAYIFDLRDNPGGLLTAAVDVASKFIPAGTVVWVQERGGQRNSLATSGETSAHHLPLVVLVNHYSASASEIVSGAIKDTHSGTLVGLTTWGKGLVQEIIPLNDDSAIALTTAHYFTPNGSDINLKGVTPDIVSGHIVPEPDDETPAAEAAYQAELDRVNADQLQQAVSSIKARIAPPADIALKP